MAPHWRSTFSTLQLVMLSTFAAFLFFTGYLATILRLALYVTASAGGLIAAVAWFLHSGKSFRVSIPTRCHENLELQFETKKLLEAHQNSAAACGESSIPTPLISRSVDHVISEILDMTIRDYVKSWYKDIVHEPDYMASVLKEEIWKILEKLLRRLRNIDEVTFLTDDVVKIVHSHLQNIRLASQKPPNNIPFPLSPHLADEDSEKKYLRNVTDVLLVVLLPKQYAQCQGVRQLLREILVNTVFYSSISMFCDPDYINQKLLTYLQWQQAELERHSRPYSYAETYEDFIQMINNSIDIEELKRMRYTIVSEIMQATTINNLKRAKGVDLDKESSPITHAKGDLLQARNLRRYINQLRYAKNQCEKRVKLLGGPDYMSTEDADNARQEARGTIPGRKVLSFNLIMESRYCREQFAKYLEKEESAHLVRFWETVQEMKCANTNNSHRLGNEIFQMYSNIVSNYVKLPKNIIKGMEEFIMGNKGPEAFFEAQELVYKALEERFYPSFIVSNIYHTMIAQTEGEMLELEKEIIDHSDIAAEKGSEDAGEVNCGLSVTIASHSNSSKARLQHLATRLNNKLQAFEALNSIAKPDMKKLQILDKEITDLKIEKRELEDHIQRTDAWSEHLGKWKASIHTTQFVKDGDRKYPVFIIVVHLDDQSSVSSTVNHPTAWVVRKSVQDFHNLKRQLLPVAPWLKTLELPSPSKLRFKSSEEMVPRNHLHLIQTFLTVLTVDEQINKSEALYAFLSPSPSYLKQPTSPKKTGKFSLAQLFKSDVSSHVDNRDDDVLLLLDDDDAKDDKRDSIAEPLYALMDELFELKGVFNWMRRTLIVFVQVTFGKTINRQIRETVAWMLSEPMLLYYLQNVKDSLWPGGVLAKPSRARSEAEKEETRHQAKEYLMKSIPQLLINLVGQQNARKGASKAFEAVQDVRLNKQLFYNTLEQFVCDLVPELKKSSPVPSSEENIE